MLVRCGAAACILVLFASLLFVIRATGGGGAMPFVLLGCALVFFLGIEATRWGDKSNPARASVGVGLVASDAASTSAPKDIQTVDDMVAMLGDALTVAYPVPTIGRFEPIDVLAVLTDIAKRKSSLRLEIKSKAKPLHTLASHTALTRALEILIDNALDNGTRAAVSCDHGVATIMIFVDDDGPGIARADRASIFDWHYYMSTTPSAQKGCRAELVVARQVFRAHGGDIYVGPSPLGGARFSAQLPFVDAHEIDFTAVS